MYLVDEGFSFAAGKAIYSEWEAESPSLLLSMSWDKILPSSLTNEVEEIGATSSLSVFSLVLFSRTL